MIGTTYRAAKCFLVPGLDWVTITASNGATGIPFAIDLRNDDLQGA